MNAGYIYAITAHVLWGLFPLYWRLLDNVGALELAAHRIVWSFFLLALGIVPLIGRMGLLLAALRDRQILQTYALAAVLIAINWFAFLQAIQTGRILEASLGYYINPLFSVLLGVAILRERLLPVTAIVVAIAACGVAVMVYATGHLPWISLAMASSFALYGLVKKRAPLNPLVGLTIETGLLIVPAALILAVVWTRQSTILMERPAETWGLLLVGGLITIAPLSLFAASASRIPLIAVGMLQYIGPTLQFLIGAFVFQESLSRWRLAGFALVWLSLALYVGSVIYGGRGRRRAQPAV